MEDRGSRAEEGRSGVEKNEKSVCSEKAGYRLFAINQKKVIREV